ncbi:hypothetical protein ACHAXT_008194 [Thalassiosira profunda]
MTAMAPPESSAGDDEFSAFESGLSEYESAASNMGPPSEDAGAATSTDEGDDFFDAFAEANGVSSAEEGSGGAVEDPVSACAEGDADETPVQPAVDLVNTGATSVQPPQGDDISPASDEDPFSAFDAISEPQGTPAINEGNGVSEDFGVFGSATEDEAPSTTAEAPLAPGEDGGMAEKNGDDNSDRMSPIKSEAPEDPAILTAGDAVTAQPELEQTSNEVHDTTANAPLQSMGGDDNGCLSNPLSAFDALGVEDAPLPSLGGFASKGNGDTNLEVHEVTEGAKDAINGEANSAAEEWTDADSANAVEPAVTEDVAPLDIVGEQVWSIAVESNCRTPVESEDNPADDFGGFESDGMAGAGELGSAITSADEGKPPDATFGQSQNGEAAQETVCKENAEDADGETTNVVDGDFGSFAEPGAQEAQDDSEPVGLANGDVTKEPEIPMDDTFGGFSTSEETPTPLPLPLEGDLNQVPAPDDDLGGFSTFEAPLQADAPDGGFGDVASEEGQVPLPTDEPEDRDEDSAIPADGLGTDVSQESDIESSASNTDAVETTAEAGPEEKEDVPAAAPEPADVAETVSIKQDEKFRDFGSATSGEEEAADKDQTEDRQPSEAFGSAEERVKASSETEPVEEELPASNSAGEGDDSGFGDFTAGDTASVGSPESTTEQSKPGGNEDEAPISQTPEDAIDNGFGDFNEVEESSTEALPVSSPKEDDNAPTSQLLDDASPADDDEFGDFGGFDAAEEVVTEALTVNPPTSSDQPATAPFEDDVPVAEPKEDETSTDDVFGDFAVEPTVEAPPDSSASRESDEPELSAAKGEPATQPSAAAGAEDDEFGDFGDFNAFEEAPEGVSPESAPAEGDAAPSETPAAVASPADDEFGDFGDFDAFEEAPETVEKEAPANVEAPTTQTEQANDAEDEFGDFGDFNEFEETPEEAPTTESAPKEVVQSPAPAPTQVVLNESVRSMFDDVFASDTPTADSYADEICSELPFDVPMSEILSEQASHKEEDAADSHRSEKELAKMKQYFEDLPRSPPVTILSDEKWYPYSQYEFRNNGSPYAESAERATTPSVPEVLSIDLPTGFEASNLSPSSESKQSNNAAAASSYRATPTVVDFPSTPKSERKVANTDDPDFSQLTEAGRRFMEQLPDLSYMLKSTLSLPDKK